MENWDEELEEALVEELQALPWIDFVYMFGSTVRGDARPDSDVDIAVRIGQGAPPSPLFSLLSTCNRAVGPGKLHLVLFDQAPVMLRQRIFEEGRVLLQNNPVSRMQAQVQTMRDFFELKPEEKAEQEYHTLLQTDPEGNSRKLAILMQYRRDLEPFAAKPEAEFLAQPERHHLAARYLHMLCEGMLDLTLFVILDHGWRWPQSPVDALNVVRERNVIDFGLANRLQAWLGLRQMLAHKYAAPDHRLNFLFLRDRTGDLDEFFEWIGKFLT